jgi:hypothetical protein
MAEQLRRSPDSSWPTVPPSCPISGRRSIGSTLLPDPARRAARARVVRRQQTGIFTQRNDGSQAGFTRVVTDYATFGPSSSLIRWWLHLHRWEWKTSAAASPARLVAQADPDGIELFAKVPVTRYRYRGSKIPSRWAPVNHAWR